MLDTRHLIAIMAKQSQGPRLKHVPQRTCVACRRTGNKRGLVRVVRLADNRVAVDPTGKKAGRGAYVCAEQACWQVALGRRALERALRIDALHGDDREALLAYTHTLPLDDGTVSNEAAPML
jgi:hypothetical protein